MKYYAVQVKTRSEEKYIALYRAMYPGRPLKLYFPKRSISLRRRGIMVQDTPPVFPGYIFIEIDSEDDILKYKREFRKIDGFYHFLKSNMNICPLQDKDLETALHFIKRAGPVAGKSRVYFDANSRIVVASGPLMGLEGKIVKVNRRKGRVKIKLDLYRDSFSIDLAIEFIEPSGGKNP
ncbi:MAG: antiterminator LoaP [Treponema sp.]|jgi:transcriptional antiterminator NusG|nr:antiterminator LoaP [Treponema sp.]